MRQKRSATARVAMGRMLVAALGAAAALAACGPTDAQRQVREREQDTGFRGIMLAEPRPKIDFTLEDLDGEPFPFRERTDGHVTLLFFGYTYCPDICPIHMAQLGAVLPELPSRLQQQIKVVFVTTDPERDTPERVRQWLGSFHPGFIGLRGDLEEVNRIQVALGLPPAQLGEADARGNYEVGHSAQILAFTPDDRLTVMYPFGIRQADWLRDLPRLARVGEARS
jgi:protein SCO1